MLQHDGRISAQHQPRVLNNKYRRDPDPWIWWCHSTKTFRVKHLPDVCLTVCLRWRTAVHSASGVRTTTAAQTPAGRSVYRVWMGAGLLWGACLFFHPRKNPRTGNDPRRSQTGRQCCRICLPSKNKQEELSDGLNETGVWGPGQRLTVERVAQVDLVPQRVAQLDSDKLAVPRPLHVLFAVTVRVRVCGEGELGPNGIFPCRDGEAQHAALKLLARTTFIQPYRRRSRSPADRLKTEKTREIPEVNIRWV